MKLIDLRRLKPTLYNHKATFGTPPHNAGREDEFVYRQFKELGTIFLNRLDGEFGYVYESAANHEIMAVRDWLGEVPLHYLVSKDRIYFANFIGDLLANVPNASYEDVRAVNRSEFVTVNTLTGTITHRLYYNFNQQKLPFDYSNPQEVADYVHDLLIQATAKRLGACDPTRTAIVLSGGIDSMSVAYLASTFSKDIPVFTLQVAGQLSTDVLRSRRIAHYFGLKHRTVNICHKDIVESLAPAIAESEIYHAYNVYCAVGMHHLAKKLERKGIRHVFTGEGGNEAFGDYHDWIVKDPVTKEVLTLQKTGAEFELPVGREAYIWGNLKAEAAGRYNKQLGSGLGKHGGSRMYKPMFKHGITLLSPYLDKLIMKILANIPTEQLDSIGGKQGFMRMVFARELATGKIPHEFFNVAKIRFQDASEAGSGGITETLLKAGFNQQKVIDLFNELFQAHIVALPHLQETNLFQ